MKTVALIPAFNEGKNIVNVIIGCERYCNHVIVYDDGSTDDTSKKARRLGAEVIRSEVNKGKGAGLRNLFKRAIEMGADIVITIDGDGQHDPGDIPKLIASLALSDIVIGGREGIPSMVKSIGNKVASFGSELDTQSGFRAYRGNVLSLLIPMEDGFGVETEILQKARKNSLKMQQVSIKADYNVPQASKHGFFKHTSEWLSTLLKLELLEHPILLIIIPGFVFLIIGAWFAFHGLQYLLTEGLGSVILIIGGMILLAVGAIISVLSYIVKRERLER